MIFNRANLKKRRDQIFARVQFWKAKRLFLQLGFFQPRVRPVLRLGMQIAVMACVFDQALYTFPR